jgi:hypothetical protein
MPIRWSTLRVSQNVDEVEELMNSIRPTLCMKGYIQRIRDHIPKDALEEERKALEYGSQQLLI